MSIEPQVLDDLRQQGQHNYTGREDLTEHEKRTLMTDNTEKLGGDAMDARAYEVLEKEFQEVR
jgi:hypothetical protein